MKILNLNFEVGIIPHNLFSNQYESLELLKSFSFYQMISNYFFDLNFIYLWVWSWSSTWSTKMSAKNTSQSNDLVPLHVMLLSQFKSNLWLSTSCKHISNLSAFQSLWLLIILVFVTFLADSELLNIKSITPKVQIQWPWNLVAMCFNKYSRSL